MTRYLKVCIERLEQFDSTSSVGIDVRVGLEVGDFHSNSPVGKLIRPGFYEFSHISVFEADSNINLTIYVLDAGTSKLITSGVVDLARLLTDDKMRKAEIRLKPTGVATLRCQLFDFDAMGDFPDRLEVHVASGSGFPHQVSESVCKIDFSLKMVESEVEVCVGEHKLRTQCARRESAGGHMQWDERFMVVYAGEKSCEFTLRDSNDIEISGRFLLWEVLTHPQKIVGGEIDLVDKNGSLCGTLRVAVRMWHFKEMQMKVDVYRQKLEELRRRKQADEQLFEYCSVATTEKRAVQEAEDRLRAASSGLEFGDEIVNRMEIPATTKDQSQQQKRTLKATTTQIERDLATAEKYLQILAHAAAVQQWDAGRVSKSKIDVVERDFLSASDHSVTDEEKAAISEISRHLDPIIEESNKVSDSLTESVNATKITTVADQLYDHGRRAIGNRQKLEGLAVEAGKIAVAINERLKENRRRLRQQNRSSLLVVTSPTNFSKSPSVFPACCCCWI